MRIPPGYFLPYIIFNILAVGLIVLTTKSYRYGRITLGIFFLLSGVFNVFKAFTNPVVYIRYFGQNAILLHYRSFMHHNFHEHMALYILLFAFVQFLLSFFLFRVDYWLRFGIFGSIIFLLILSPFGVAVGFPATLIMCISLLMIHYKILKREKEKAQSKLL